MSKKIILACMRSGSRYITKKVKGIQFSDDYLYTGELEEQLRKTHAENDVLLYRFHSIPSEYPTIDKDMSDFNSNYWFMVRDLINKEDAVTIHYRSSIFDMTISRMVHDHGSERPIHLDTDSFRHRYIMNYIFSQSFTGYWIDELADHIDDLELFTYEDLARGILPFHEGVEFTDEPWKTNDYPTIVSNYDELLALKSEDWCRR